MSISRRTFLAAVAALLGMSAPELPAREAFAKPIPMRVFVSVKRGASQPYSVSIAKLITDSPQVQAGQPITTRGCNSVDWGKPSSEPGELEARWREFDGTYEVFLPAGCTIDAVRIECVVG